MSMKYIWKYKTPEGFDDLVMSGDGEALTGLWFAGSRDAVRRGAAVELRETPVFRETCRWLDEYFAGRDPGFTPNYRIEAGSKSQSSNWPVISCLTISLNAEDGLIVTPETFPFSLTLNEIETVIEASIVAAACAERLITGLAGLKSARERPLDISISTLPEPLVLVLAEVSD